ncbi:hypothetical protein BGZ93_000939 [Podila epicladia]|nr:hypothetical protein BGZ93_000939 [Podila epicladia]
MQLLDTFVHAGNGTNGDGDCGGSPMVELQWYHVAIASTLIFTNVVLIILAAYEAVYNASKLRHIYMFPSVLVSMGCSCLLVGTFVLGMLLGNTMTATALGVDSCLHQLSENKEKIELYLSLGATRWEACRPVAVEAMRTAMMPTINQMSIIGLISIPGMMTGQLIAGASVMNAVKSQQIIMFLISGAAVFGCLSAVLVGVPQSRLGESQKESLLLLEQPETVSIS